MNRKLPFDEGWKAGVKVYAVRASCLAAFVIVLTVAFLIGR